MRSWSDIDEALYEVTEGIRKVVVQLGTKPLPSLKPEVLFSSRTLTKPGLGTLLWTYRDGEEQPPYAVAWSPNKALIAYGGFGDMHILDATDGHDIISAYHGASHSITWSPDGKRIACGYSNIRIADSTTLNVLDTWKRPDGNGANTIAWSPNGQYIASGGRPTLAEIWNASSGKVLLTYQDHSDDVNTIA